MRDADSVEALFLTFGLIAGLGLSLCYVAAIAVVAFYFDKRLSLATGLAVCGSGIGTFIFAPVTQYLIKEYTWRGAMLILSGLFLNICVCGALMRDIEGTCNRRGSGKGKISRSTSAEQTSTGLRSRNCSESEGEHQRLSSDSPAVLMEIKAAADSTFLEIERETMDDTRLCNSLVNLPTFLRNGDKIPHEVLMTITNNPRLYGIVLANYPTLFDGYVVGEDKEVERSTLTMEDPAPKTFQDPITCKDATTALLANKEAHPHGQHWHAAYLNGLRVKKRSLTYRGAMLNLPRYRLRASSCPDIYRNSITTIAREKEGVSLCPLYAR